MSAWARAVTGTQPAAFSALLLQFCAEQGVDPAPVFAEFDMGVEAVEDPDRRVPAGLALLLLDRLAAIHPFVGLAAGLAVPRRSAMMHAARNAKTLGEAMVLIRRYRRLAADTLDAAPIPDRLGIALRIMPPVLTASEAPARVVRASVDAWLSSLIELSRVSTNEDVRPREVRVVYSRPAELEPLEAVYRCPLHFGCDHNALVLDPAIFALPVVERDPHLHRTLERYVARLHAELPPRDSFVSRVSTAILHLGSAGQWDIEATARRLGISVRTLQRRLASDDTSYATLVEEVRKAMARDLLRRELSVQSVALTTGYASVRSFRRAFGRWYGCTPSAFRAR